jgi:short-subunit dehydrogenase
VITARRQAALEALAAELRAAHGVAVDVVVADLGAAGGAQALWTAATGTRPVDLLVNNAGFGTFRRFATTDWARDAEMLQLNVTSLVELCHHFVTAHRARVQPGPAHILNVASIAAFQAVPHFANYGATKAYVRSFSEALHYELAAEGIAVTCLAPGGTESEFHGVAGAGGYGKLASASMLSAEAVAEVGVRAVLAGKKTVVPGVLNRVAVGALRLLPTGLQSRASAFVMGPPRDQALPPRGRRT